MAYEIKLANAANDNEIVQIVEGLLKDKSCLWVSPGINTFTNLFLIALRHTSIDTYRAIINELYLIPSGTKFLDGKKITLYRYDMRKSKEIFKDGFTPNQKDNNPNIVKIKYAINHENMGYSGKIGISTSTSKKFAKESVRSFARKAYLNCRFYEIKLPPNHHVLGIPFVGTTCDEVNIMEEIPGANVMKCYSLGFFGFKVKKNPNYQKNVIVSPRITRGCY